MTVPIKHASAKRRFTLLAVLVTIALLTTSVAVVLAGPVSNGSGFQGDDGDLDPATNPVTGDLAPGIDWNSFSPVEYMGTAPNRQADKDAAGWHFTGLTDAQATNTDSGFAGGTKQDDDCATITGSKAPNKSDLKRAYFANAKVGEDVYVALAWVRIPQNTTSPSSHVGFEFNQGDQECAAGHPLVFRTPGDLLVVYDFQGGSADTPKITLRRWIGASSALSCEVSNKSAPCWGEAVDLTASGDAEAAVNTLGPVQDQVSPLSPAFETLGTNEFGEAIINLSDAIAAIGGDRCVAFGKAYAVSRSSGNSGTAQMKDLVGPGEVDIRTCGGMTITKETGEDDGTEFDFTIEPDPANGASFAFSLEDGESEVFEDVPNDTYTVTEDDPGPNYALTDITCVVTGDAGTTWVADLDTLSVEIDLMGEDEIECTFTNTLQAGALLIEKQSTKSGNPLVSNAGAVFSYENGSSGSVTDNGTDDEDDDVGSVCVSGLEPGTYTVNETSPPDGYAGAPLSQADQEVTVEAGTDCDENLPGEGATATFTNDPLADIQVRFRDGGSGETSLDTPLSCDVLTGTSSTTGTTGWDDTLTIEDIPINGTLTITCTIEIDP